MTTSTNEDLKELREELVNEYGELVVKSAESWGINLNQIEDLYRGTWDSEEAYIEDYIESTGLLDSIPENLQCYFDYDAFLNDMKINGEIRFDYIEGEYIAWSNR